MARLHDWRGALWGRPCSVIPILDEDAQILRLRLLLHSNGVKEGLVSSPREWPGATSVHGLLGDMRVSGKWIDRDGFRRATRSWRRKRATVDLTKEMTVELSPLPVWSDLMPSELRARHEALVESIEHQGRFRRQLYLGVKAILAVEPHARSTEATHEPAPCCHASSPRIDRGSVRCIGPSSPHFAAPQNVSSKHLQ